MCLLHAFQKLGSNFVCLMWIIAPLLKGVLCFCFFTPSSVIVSFPFSTQHNYDFLQSDWLNKHLGFNYSFYKRIIKSIQNDLEGNYFNVLSCDARILSALLELLNNITNLIKMRMSPFDQFTSAAKHESLLEKTELVLGLMHDNKYEMNLCQSTQHISRRGDSETLCTCIYIKKKKKNTDRIRHHNETK